jgi:D-alanyl-D-alanine carboxypeptidase
LLYKIFTSLLFFTILFNQQVVSAKSITAKSWLISDMRGTIIDGENIDVVRPIASITKLLTVMVVLDANQNVDEKITMTTNSTTYHCPR